MLAVKQKLVSYFAHFPRVILDSMFLHYYANKSSEFFKKLRNRPVFFPFARIHITGRRQVALIPGCLFVCYDLDETLDVLHLFAKARVFIVWAIGPSPTEPLSEAARRSVKPVQHTRIFFMPTKIQYFLLDHKNSCNPGFYKAFKSIPTFTLIFTRDQLYWDDNKGTLGPI